MNNDVGVRGDNLLLGSQLVALLELEVANSPGKGKVAVDSAKVDESSGSSDTCLLTCKKRRESVTTLESY